MMRKSNFPRVTFQNLEFSPRNFPKFNNYHEQVKGVFKRLYTVDKLTTCDPPLNYRLHRIKSMTGNPRVIFAECSYDNALVIPASEISQYFSQEPKVTEISKGEVELLDSKRTPVILVCPLNISFGKKTDLNTELPGLKPNSLSLHERKSKSLNQERNLLSLKPGRSLDQLNREQATTLYEMSSTKCLSEAQESHGLQSGLSNKQVLNEDHGYSSMEKVNGDPVQEQVKDQINKQVSLALGCISDEEATSILFLVKPKSKGTDEKESRSLICKALKEIFPDTYGNRTENPDVCFLNDKLPGILDTMLQNVLLKQMKLLQASVERIQKDFATQATTICPDTESHLKNISETVHKLVVPDKQELLEIAETVKHNKNDNSRTSVLYSDYLGNQILYKVIQDAFSYVHREFSPMDKTIFSNAITKSRLQNTLGHGMVPNWTFLLALVFTAFVLFILVTTNHFGFLEAIGLEVVIIHLLVQTETSSFYTKYVVSSVQRYLESNVKTIVENIYTEHQQSLYILNRRKEVVYKAQIQIRRMMRDLQLKMPQHKDAGSRMNGLVEEYLLNSPGVIGFGSMNGKLYVHVLDETMVESVQQTLIDIYKLKSNECVICPSLPSKESAPHLDLNFHSPISIGRPISSKLGFLFQNCNGNVFFVIRSSLILRCQSVTICLSNNKCVTGKLKARTDDQSFNNTNLYPLTIFQIEEETSPKIKLHNCNNGKQHPDGDTTGLTVEIPHGNGENSKLDFLVLSDRYVYKVFDANNSTRIEVSLAVPVGLEETTSCMDHGLIKYKHFDSKEPLGLLIGILKRVPFQCDNKVDLGKEDLLAVIPYNRLLNFLHIICCDSEEIHEQCTSSDII